MSFSLVSGLRNALASLALMAALSVPVIVAANVLPLSVETMSSMAEDVVHGTVTKQRLEMINSIPMTVSTLQVAERFKGASGQSEADTVDVVSVGGKTAYYGVTSSASVELTQGEEVVLFLSNPGRRRLLEQGPDSVDAQSPMVKYPQVVGGFQGKFKVVRQTITEQMGTQTATREVLRVSRPTPGRSAARLEALPPLEVFKTQLRAVTSGAVPTRATTLRLSPASAPLSVPEALESNTALRFFDPVNQPLVVNPAAMTRIDGGAAMPAGPAPRAAAEPLPAAPSGS